MRRFARRQLVLSFNSQGAAPINDFFVPFQNFPEDIIFSNVLGIERAVVKRLFYRLGYQNTGEQFLEIADMLNFRFLGGNNARNQNDALLPVAGIGIITSPGIMLDYRDIDVDCTGFQLVGTYFNNRATTTLYQEGLYVVVEA